MDKKEYKPLTLPSLSWDKKELTEKFGQLTAQPLEQGFGVTLGNAIRRALLGSVEGSAVTSVIIKGVNNEFSPLPGVLEDVMQLILNIKEIVIQNKDGKPGKMYVKKTGKGPVTVADIQSDDHLKLINTDHVIAHLDEDGDLDIEFFVETGRGYQPAKWPIGEKLQDDNRIFLDAMFSPIKKVTFDVEKTRVGKAIDYDKLILKVYTDGSENPIDVIHYAVSVLRTQLEHFLVNTEIAFNDFSVSVEEEKKEAPVKLEKLGLNGIPFDLLLKPIDELELSVRAHNCLLQAGVKRILDLVNLPEEEALRIKNFGRKSLNEVKASMKAFGLSFDMDIKEEDLNQVLNNKI